MSFNLVKKIPDPTEIKTIWKNRGKKRGGSNKKG